MTNTQKNIKHARKFPHKTQHRKLPKVTELCAGILVHAGQPSPLWLCLFFWYIPDDLHPCDYPFFWYMPDDHPWLYPFFWYMTDDLHPWDYPFFWYMPDDLHPCDSIPSSGTCRATFTPVTLSLLLVHVGRPSPLWLYPFFWHMPDDLHPSDSISSPRTCQMAFTPETLSPLLVQARWPSPLWLYPFFWYMPVNLHPVTLSPTENIMWLLTLFRGMSLLHWLHDSGTLGQSFRWFWNTKAKAWQLCHMVRLLVDCSTSQQQARVSQEPICTDNFKCCHTEIE